MRAGVSFQIESVVEALAADRAQVALNVAVAFQVSTQHSLLRKELVADAAPELVVNRLLACIVSYSLQFKFQCKTQTALQRQ